MNSAILGGLTLKDLALKTRRAIYQHNCLGRAAELAFYFLLALFPLLIFLLNLISFMPGVQETILFWLSRLMPPDATRIVETWVQDVFANRSGGLISFGLIFSLWAASSGVGALIAALNSAYEVEEGRPVWKARARGTGIGYCAVPSRHRRCGAYNVRRPTGPRPGQSGRLSKNHRHDMAHHSLLDGCSHVDYRDGGHLYLRSKRQAKMDLDRSRGPVCRSDLCKRFLSVFPLYPVCFELQCHLLKSRGSHRPDALVVPYGTDHVHWRRDQFPDRKRCRKACGA